MAKDWRDSLDPLLQEHLEGLLKEVGVYKDAFYDAKNVAHAQLWIALAILIKQNFEQKMRINILERALQDMGPKKKKLKVDPNKELKKVLKQL